MAVNFQDSDCEGFEHWANIPNYSQSPLVPPTPENLFRLGMGVELNEVNYPSMLCVGMKVVGIGSSLCPVLKPFTVRLVYSHSM